MTVALVSMSLAAALACGGGGGGGGGGVVESGLTASFVPDPRDAGPGTVSMHEHSVVGDAATIEIRVTDASGVYGAAFDIVYDPAVARFEGWGPGALLERGGNAPNYTVVSAKPGVVVVGASRTGNIPGVDAEGGMALLRITFRLLREGSTPVSFRSSSLTDDRLPPQEIPGLSWFGGTLSAI